MGAALLGFQGEINFGGFAFFDLNVLRRSAGFAVGCLDLVFTRGDIGDLEGAVLA